MTCFEMWAPILALSAAGCVSQERAIANVSASRVGCPSEQISISDVVRSGTRPISWTARCNGATWSCKRDLLSRVTCEPAP
jgi:hypothetical protein